MVVQIRNNVNTTPFIRHSGPGALKQDGVIEQDAARVADLASFTVLAKKASTQKYWPLTDVSPSLVPSNLACGAIGCTLAEIAALASASFKIGFDGEDVIEVVCDFSGIDAEGDTPGSYLCGVQGTNIAGWQAVSDGSVSVTVDGINVVVLTGLDFSTAATLNDVADTINYAAAGQFTVLYDGKLEKYMVVSPTAGEKSAIGSITTGGVGTDISAAGFLNQTAGAATAGTGGENLGESIVDIINAELAGRGECSFDGDKFIFWSNSTEYASAVSYLTAGVTGTDISGAGYLNGLTGTGVITAATVGDGLDLPAAIYIGPTIATASLVAGDIEDLQILIGDAFIDQDQVVLENSLALTDIVTGLGMSIYDALGLRGIRPIDTEAFSAQENT